MTLKLKITKTRGLLALVAIAALVLTSFATAYFTGKGNAKKSQGVVVSSSTSVPLAVDTSSVNNQLSPGGSASIALHYHNPGSTPVQVTSVGADSSQGNAGIGGLPAGCDRAWFSVGSDNTAVTLTSAGQGADAAVPISMSDSGTDQSACAGATLTFYLNISG